MVGSAYLHPLFFTPSTVLFGVRSFSVPFILIIFVMSQIFIVTISYSDYYDSDYNVKSITVPDSETVETVKEVFLNATNTYDEKTSYNVYTLEEWLKMSSYDDWETVRNDITNRAKKHKKIRSLQEKIEHMKDGKTKSYSDRQIEEWEREIEKLYET